MRVGSRWALVFWAQPGLRIITATFRMPPRPEPGIRRPWPTNSPDLTSILTTAHQTSKSRRALTALFQAGIWALMGTPAPRLTSRALFCTNSATGWVLVVRCELERRRVARVMAVGAAAQAFRS